MLPGQRLRVVRSRLPVGAQGPRYDQEGAARASARQAAVRDLRAPRCDLDRARSSALSHAPAEVAVSEWIQRFVQLFWPDVSFATPWVLWLAVLAPVFMLLFYMWDSYRRRALTIRLGELPVIGRVMASSSPGRRVVKDVVVGLGLTLVLFAIARPQLEGERRVEVRGLDVAIAVDVSKSMLVEDVGSPTKAMQATAKEANRLNRARELAVQLIDALPGDRIAPLVFAGGAAHYPITEDQQAAARFLTDLGPTDLPPGSNLAELFKVARCELRPDAYDELECKKVEVRRGHGGDPLR